ncbi:TKL protein kinase, variant 1 [Capsaspora owczarzaki ATCC 30864]|uniref:TKL protein kinase, variant 1 n=2 Tax=Capsaspora owczarzaki (strain ATCC 30864) TaxID=595528 RepID=A0A0D2U8F5_CAPO3|nr:TKL protein kinase, variant 1 [Capsaspora owczarzaki ATCC 30864]
MASSSYSSNGTMKALGLATEYGGPELLTQVTVPRPTLRSENDIIVQIKAAAMNPVDYKVREGQKGGSVTGGPRILGYDGAGVVVHTGSSAHAKRFSVGDEVYFAGDISRSGTNAEFTAVDARIVGFKPKSLSWNEAASLPLVTLTAFEALEEQMNIPERAAPEAKPKSILILAGAGGVGSLAIQISKRLLHLRVVATASRPETSDYVRKLGADVVIDHHKPLREQLTSSGFENGQVDYVLLCHDLSAAKFPEYVDILAPLGTIGTITPDAGIDQQTNSCDEGSSSRAHNAGGSSPAAAAAGAAAAGVVVLIAIVAVLLIVRRRKRSRNNLRMDKSPATIEMTTPGVASGRQKHNSNDSAKVVASQTQQDKSRPASASHSVPAGSGNANTDYSTPLKATSKSTSGPASTTVDPSTAYSIAVVSTAALLSSQIATGTRKLLGRGNFGQVFSANVSIALIAPQHRHLFAPGAQTVDVAVKTLLLDANARAEQDFVLEAELLRKLNHTNIVNVLAVLPAGRGQPQMLVLEYVPYGDLRNLLRQSAKCDVAWSPEEYVHVATGIAAGMGYLEQARVLHRDLAARNVLVGSHLVAKIADFGLSRELNDKDYYKLQSKQKLPVRWMAPETLNYRKFSSQSDVFSYGVVLWELFTMGQPPWADVERDQYLVGLKRGDRLPQPPTCPAQLYSLMLATWEWDPSARPSFADCVGLLQPLRPPRGSVRDLGALVRGRSNTNG